VSRLSPVSGGMEGLIFVELIVVLHWTFGALHGPPPFNDVPPRLLLSNTL